MSKKVILSIENLKKYFINKGVVNKAVNNVSFNVHEGEIVGLIGESGSGKTTVGRSLLRLYDDFNGFVTLDGDIISGKKITRQKRKRMRKNIQMIFQDPHASLNGQKTIFSILKEPLIVNNIIKNEIDDLKKDWYLIQDNFHFTFLEKNMEYKLRNLKLFNTSFSKFINTWNDKIENINFDITKTNDDNFNLVFSYLEEKNKINSNVINDLYKTNEKLLALYYEKQKNYRDNNLDFDESALAQAQKEYDQALVLSKKSQRYISELQNFKTLKHAYKEVLGEKKEVLETSKNLFLNLLEENKNEIQLQKNNAYSSYDLNFYIHSIKLHELSKAKMKVLKNAYKNMRYLNFDQIKNLIKDLNLYSSEFFDNKLNVSVNKESRKEIIGIINQYFSFNSDKYAADSKQKHNLFNQKIQELNSQINKSKKLLNSYKNDQAEISADKLNPYLQKLNEANQVHNEEVRKYVLEFQKRIEVLNKEILEAQSQKDQIIKNINQVDAKFPQAFKKFELFFNNEVILKAKKELKVAKKTLAAKVNTTDSNQKNESLTSKLQTLKKLEFLFKNKFIFKIKSLLKIDNKDSTSKDYIRHLNKKYKSLIVELQAFKNTVKKRYEGIKSFDAENKYLLKDLNSIQRLLGIKREYNITYQNKYRKIIWNILDLFNTFFIKALFIKNKIYKALDDVGLLKQFASRYPHEFSGGQRQRIVIARALITDPKVIVADEPIASLDISIQAQVVNLLKDLCKKKNIGMIFIAHDLSMIEYVADTVQIMHLGKIVESGKTESIYSRPLHPYTINLFKAIPKMSNANEKFRNITFDLDYLNEQQFPNIPTIHNVDETHNIYGTLKQVQKWLSNDKESK
ncbi:ATP-binding cassette domain-containing protein [Mycoplasmopsis ciconiae]|uniref:ATP-binding cassette domain-containing protein n=1 Tax=Mycoplasmopsis ciconiae TaxID=561067 RepID=A0ABU7MM48_9BACT|nr:ATP-binding cassette domain-containing protein [Mycoplasmopsis ciconiae]